MVVKSATKKKLMDLGIEEEYAHKLADDRKWDDVKGLSWADRSDMWNRLWNFSENPRCHGQLSKVQQGFCG